MMLEVEQLVKNVHSKTNPPSFSYENATSFAKGGR